MSPAGRRLILALAGILLGLLLLATVLLVLRALGFFWPGSPMMSPVRRLPASFASNGERIFFTATSQSGRPITAEMPGMHRMPEGAVACASCHGPDARGGRVVMMMGVYEAPDIRYHTLAEEDHADEHDGHPPYTDETLRRAITEGIDPAGEALDWPMPRFSISPSDLDDLIAYLKTLE